MYGAIKYQRSTNLNSQAESEDFHVKHWWIVTLFAYVSGFFAIYWEMPIAVRFGVAIVLLFMQLLSFRHAATILLLSLFLPFFSPLLGEGVLRFNRLAIFPFAFMAIQRPTLRRFPANTQLLIIALIAITLIKITADLQTIFQISQDPTHQFYNKELKNYLAEYYDIFTALFLIYMVYTKLTNVEIRLFFKSTLLIGVLMATSIIYIAATNFGAVVSREKGVLWDSPLFNHKQYWGPLMFVLFIIEFVIFFDSKNKTFVKVIPILLVLGAVMVSLSRTAYISIILGIILYGFLGNNLKKLIYILGIMLLMAPVVLQFDLVRERMESIVAADDVNEFQSESAGHFSDKAMNQYVQNFTFVPQIFYTDWEYNYSEGFWNGILHQAGIIGFLIIVFVYIRLIRRYSYLFRTGNEATKTLALAGQIITFLSIIINIIVRHVFFINYFGTITGLSLLLMVIYLTAEISYKEDTNIMIK